MRAKIHISEFETDSFRVLHAVGYKGKSIGWRWALIVDINGFKITKRSDRAFESEQEAIDNAESEGIEIIYPGV